MYNKSLKLIVSAFILLSMDALYLHSIKNYFAKQIILVQGSPVKINYLSAIISYMFLIFGLNYFILQHNCSVFDAFLLGLVIYGVYETTTKALFYNWSWIIVFIDTLWGGILFALTTFIYSTFLSTF